MTVASNATAPAPNDVADESVETEVRAAFTERMRAEVARLIADSLAARAAIGMAPGAGGASRGLRQEAAAHEEEAHLHEERVAFLRQLEHDGRQ